MFLTEKTKTDVLHILVRTHLLVLTCLLLVIIDQICRKRSRSIWIMVQVRGPGRCSNLVKNMLTRFFEGPVPGNFGLKISPLREIPLLRKSRGQAGRGHYEHASKKFLSQTI